MKSYFVNIVSFESLQVFLMLRKLILKKVEVSGFYKKIKDLVFQKLVFKTIKKTSTFQKPKIFKN